MNYNMDIKTKIAEWFNSPQDYEEGLELLQETGIKRHKVLSKLMKGSSKTRAEKLAYLLSKEIGLRAVPPPAAAGAKKPGKQEVVKEKQVQKKAEDPAPQVSDRLSLIGKTESIDDYPEAVKKVILEYSSLYNERGIVHKDLRELGEDNDSDTVSERKELVEKIKSISGRLEELYVIFSDYKTKAIIPENKPADPLSVEDLKRLKKNLQASIVKDKNQLLYRSKTKPEDGEENPLPDGPRRIRLERRIKAKEKQIADLEMKIAKAE